MSGRALYRGATCSRHVNRHVTCARIVTPPERTDHRTGVPVNETVCTVENVPSE
jgi:hypothetical protein